MALTHLTSETFDQAVNAGDDLVVVDFFATWCGPCKMLAPTVEKMAELHPEVHFYKVDIDEDMDLATRFKVMSCLLYTSDLGGMPLLLIKFLPRHCGWNRLPAQNHRHHTPDNQGHRRLPLLQHRPFPSLHTGHPLIHTRH